MSGEVNRIVLPAPANQDERVRTVNAMAVLWNVALIPRDVTHVELEQVERTLRYAAHMPGPSLPRALMRRAWEEGRRAGPDESNPYLDRPDKRVEP